MGNRQLNQTNSLLNPKDVLPKIDFKRYLPKLENNGYFSEFKPLEEEKLTAVENQRRKDEAKKKEKDDWKKKMVVDDPTFRVGLKPVGVQVLDKYKGLLSDPPKNPSLRLPAKYTKDKVVMRDDHLKPLPISYNLEEKKLSKHDIEQLTRINRNFDVQASIAPSDFDTIKAKNKESFIYKRRVQDVFGDN